MCTADTEDSSPATVNSRYWGFLSCYTTHTWRFLSSYTTTLGIHLKLHRRYWGFHSSYTSDTRDSSLATQHILGIPILLYSAIKRIPLQLLSRHSGSLSADTEDSSTASKQTQRIPLCAVLSRYWGFLSCYTKILWILLQLHPETAWPVLINLDPDLASLEIK